MKRAFLLVVSALLLGSLAEGQQMLSGAGMPGGAIGNNGDLYHRTDISAVYGPKAGGAWPSTFSYTVGVGCTTAYHIDKDCDGYGVGPTQLTVDPNPLFNVDADDNDATVNTPASVITKWGTMSAFLTHLGYPTSRIVYIDPVNGSDSTGAGTVGNPYQTWSPVITSLSYAGTGAGATLLYRGGVTALGNYLVNSHLPYASSPSNPVVVMPYPGERGIVHGISGDSQNYGKSANVTYDGWTLSCPTVGAGNGFDGNHDDGITIKNSEISGCSHGWQVGGGGQNLTIDGNVFHDTQSHAVYPTSAGLYASGQFNCSGWNWDTTGGNFPSGFNPFKNLQFKNNLVYNAGTGGLEAVHLNAMICGGAVTGNFLHNIGGTGLGLQTSVQGTSSAPFLVANNVIFSNQSSAITISIYGCDNNGMPVSAGQTDCTSSGLPVGGGPYYPNDHDYISIINNTLWTGQYASQGGGQCNPTSGPGQCTIPSYGIQVNDYEVPFDGTMGGIPANHWIKNLTIENNLILTYNDCGGGSNHFKFLTNSFPDTDTIKNNMLWNLYPGNSQCLVMNITPDAQSASPGDYAFTNFQSYNTSNNSGNLFNDPLFTDVALGYYATPNLFNFHLKGTSPAIGAGTSTGVLATDIAGLARPNPPSIGAYEPGSGSVTSGAAAQLIMASGNNQSGTVGQPLGSPLAVLVTDSSGNPVQGTSVTFASASGGGTLSVSQATTNATGQASTSLTLGASAGTDTVTVTSSGLTGSPITFTASASAGVGSGGAATLVMTSGNSQSGTVGQPLSSPFVVTITDVNGNPVPGMQVAFAVVSGGGSLSAAQVATNASGQASSMLTLGPVAGSNVVTATSGGSLTGNPATFTAMATAASGATWVKSPWSLVPFFRGFNRLVYDPVLGRTLIGASENATTIYSDSYWAYDSTAHAWTQMTTTGVSAQCVSPLGSNPPAHPANRHPYHGLAYDTTRGQMYLFSGVCQGYPFTDTWAYKSSQNTWTQLSPATNPGARLEGAMTYDSAHDVVVLYGGLAPNPAADTWQYAPASNTWSQVGSNGAPGPIAGHSMVYDSINRKVVLFGGYTTYGGTALNGTWIYDAGTHTWTNPTPSVNPPGAYYPAMAFDSKRGLVVLYVGTSAMWGYNVATNQWLQLPVTGGPAPVDVSGSNCPQCLTLAYDAGTDKYILTSQDPSFSTATWELSLGTGGSSSPSYDLNGDGLVNLLDVQLAVSQVLGSSPCTTADFNHVGQCSVVDVQLIVSYILSH